MTHMDIKAKYICDLLSIYVVLYVYGSTFPYGVFPRKYMYSLWEFISLFPKEMYIFFMGIVLAGRILKS